jgi:hypothetical protein
MSYKQGFNYENILALTKKYSCTLINSENDLKNKLCYINLIGKCGHKTQTTYNKLFKYKIGVLCHNCLNKISNNHQSLNFICSNSSCNKNFIPSISSFLYCSEFCKHARPQSNSTKQKISNSVVKTYKNKTSESTLCSLRLFDLHTFGNKYIRELLRYKIDIELANRKSTHNLMIKPCTESNNNWFPIEIKYSDTKVENNYFFTIKKTYHNLFIILAHISDKKYWIIPPNKIKSITRLRVNILNKFSEYLVEEDNLVNKLIQIYQQQTVLHINNTIGIMPENLDYHSLTELKYINLRKEKISFLQFDKPISNFLTYNFLVNDFKIQESVAFISKNDKHQYIMTTLRKSIEEKSVPYDYDDNDFYWFNEPNEDIFYVVSRDVLREKGFVRYMTIGGKISLNISTNQYWLSEHKFSYKTISEDMEQKLKLINLFQK